MISKLWRRPQDCFHSSTELRSDNYHSPFNANTNPAYVCALVGSSITSKVANPDKKFLSQSHFEILLSKLAVNPIYIIPGCVPSNASTPDHSHYLITLASLCTQIGFVAIFHIWVFKITSTNQDFDRGIATRQSNLVLGGFFFFPLVACSGMIFRSLEEFWSFYVTQHSKQSTRRWHFAGTLAGILCLLYSLIFNWRFIFFVPLFGYGFGWYSHFFVEGNVPATYGHPLWSFLCDFKMFGLMLTGQMDREIKRLGKRPVSQSH